MCKEALKKELGLMSFYNETWFVGLLVLVILGLGWFCYQCKQK